MIEARVAGVPRPFSRMASRSSSSSMSLPAPSMAESSVAFVQARRRPRGARHRLDLLGRDALVRLHRRERALLALRFAPVHREPAGIHQHLAFGLEGLAGDARDPRSDLVLGRRIERREKALHHEIVELGLELVQMLRRDEGRNDGEVIGDLRVVEDALVRTHPAGLEHLAREAAVRIGLAQGFHGRLHRVEIILGQRARVRARVGEDLVLLVQRLGERERGSRREAEAAVGLALQRGEVVEHRGDAGRRFRFLGDLARLAGALRDERDRPGLFPEALGARVGILVLLAEGLVEPAAGVFAAAAPERALHLPIVARLEHADLFLALDQDGERGRLHPSHRRELEAAGLRVERGHGPRSIDADQPVRFRAAHRGVGERAHLLVRAQPLEAVANGCGGHRLQPQPADGLGRLRELHDVAEDELALPPGVAGVDELADVLALEELQQRLETVLVLLDGLQREPRRDRRQVGEGPLAALHLLLFGHPDLEQVADCRRQHVAVALEVVVVTW